MKMVKLVSIARHMSLGESVAENLERIRTHRRMAYIGPILRELQITQ